MDDRRELAKLKQGLDETTETETPIAVPQTFKKKISNFFYHNIWWLWFTIIFVFIGVFLIFNLASREDADLTLLIFVKNERIEEISPKLAEYFESFTPDINGDGKVIVNYFYMPYSGQVDASSMEEVAISQNISIQLGDYENLIVIADSSCDEIIKPQSHLYDLSIDIKDNPIIVNQKIMLSKTDLREKLGYEYYFSDDCYIAIRKTKKENFAPQYDILKEFLNKITPSS